MTFRRLLPTLATAIAVAVLSTPGTAQADSVVQISTPLGDIVVELDPTAAPNTVDNFLKYIADGDYTNSFIHRNANTANSGVNVIQGGGFTIADTGVVADLDLDAFPSGAFNGQTNFGLVSAVQTDDAIANEFNQSNLRGTIAMARVGGNADSATSQWFINVTDNVALDTIDGGFTVFGTVTSGMDVVDVIHGLSDATIGNPSNADLFPLSDVPLLETAVAPSIEQGEVVLTDISVVSVIPEPSSIALLALGGLALTRRRR